MKSHELNNLFTGLNRLFKKHEKQIRDGYNDYSLLGAVLRVNDEVRLHSRFLYSLLNPKAKHYRGTDFLEEFMRVIGRARWLNLDNARVRREYDRRDLYITDGQRRVVIENKLDAPDSEHQVWNHLDAIGCLASAAQNGRAIPAAADDMDTLFIYLSKGRSRPSRHALGKDLRIEEPFIVKGEHPVSLYQHISYRKNVKRGSISLHDWLDRCEKLDNLAPNLIYAIQDYRKAVEQATAGYSNMKDDAIRSFLEKSGERNLELAVRLANSLYRGKWNIRAEWLHCAMENGGLIDAFLRNEINGGKLVPIDMENRDILKQFMPPGVLDVVYEEYYNFFIDGQMKKNRGRFFHVKSGPYSQKAVIMVHYGTHLLHVGCAFDIHLDKSETGKVEKYLASLGLEAPNSLRENHFPKAFTRAKNLNSDIWWLVEFATSGQSDGKQKPEKTEIGRLLQGIMKHLQVTG